MPDLSLLQPLSRILKVGVNDLLSGEIISEKEYRKKSETNIIGLVDLNILKSPVFLPLSLHIARQCIITDIG